MGRKPNTGRSDLEKGQPKTKAKERDEAYRKYQSYIRSKAFKEVRKIVYERDGGKCMICNRTRQNGVTLATHHRCYEHLYAGGETEANDCILLCNICHSAIHRAKKNYRWFSMKNPRNNNITTKDEGKDLEEG